MAQHRKQHKDVSPLPFFIIEDASAGDGDAVREVVNHYERYILALSTVRVYDDDGKIYTFVDETLRRELELKLITKLIGFKFKASK